MTATERLKAIRERAERATPGPWERRDTLIGVDKYHASTGIVGHVLKTADGKPLASTPVARLQDGFIWFEGDCDFIPAARTDVPDLVKCLEAVMARIQETKGVLPPTDEAYKEADMIEHIINRELGGEA